MLKIELIGNVGTSRLITAAGKSPVLNISMATNRRVGEREFVDWPHELTPRCGGVAVPAVWLRACVHIQVYHLWDGEWYHAENQATATWAVAGAPVQSGGVAGGWKPEMSLVASQ